MRKQYFSLVELVVVLALVFLLAGMLVPLQKGVRDSSELGRCMNNLKQIGTGLALYSSDTSYGVMPAKGPKACLMMSNLISDHKVFNCPGVEVAKVYQREFKQGGLTHKVGEWFSSYKRSGQSWNPELKWDKGWAVKFKFNVVICGDAVLNHGGENGVYLFKDGHSQKQRFSYTVNKANFDTTHVDDVIGTYSHDDRLYKYDEDFNEKIHDGKLPKVETNTMLLFSEEDWTDSPTLKDGSPFYIK